MVKGKQNKKINVAGLARKEHRALEDIQFGELNRDAVFSKFYAKVRKV